jgi:hypothetical protein
MKPARNAVASATYLISPRLFTPPLRDTGDGSVGRLRCSSIITSWDDCYTGIAKRDSDLLFACLWPQPMRLGGRELPAEPTSRERCGIPLRGSESIFAKGLTLLL